jgi:hypothetical protein
MAAHSLEVLAEQVLAHIVLVTPLVHRRAPCTAADLYAGVELHNA